MNKKINLGLLVFLFIILVVGFCALKGSDKVSLVAPNVSTATEGAVLEIAEAKTASVPATWKTYTMKTPYMNFSFKHPSNFLFKEVEGIASSAGGIYIYQDSPAARAFIKGEATQKPLGMHIAASNDSRTIEEYISSISRGDTTAASNNYAAVELLGKTVYVVTGQGMDYWDRIVFSHNNRVYEVTIAYGMPTDETRDLFYTLLASLEFKD